MEFKRWKYMCLPNLPSTFLVNLQAYKMPPMLHGFKKESLYRVKFKLQDPEEESYSVFPHVYRYLYIDLLCQYLICR